MTETESFASCPKCFGKAKFVRNKHNDKKQVTEMYHNLLQARLKVFIVGHGNFFFSQAQFTITTGSLVYVRERVSISEERKIEGKGIPCWPGLSDNKPLC